MLLIKIFVENDQKIVFEERKRLQIIDGGQPIIVDTITISEPTHLNHFQPYFKPQKERKAILQIQITRKVISDIIKVCININGKEIKKTYTYACFNHLIFLIVQF